MTAAAVARIVIDMATDPPARRVRRAVNAARSAVVLALVAVVSGCAATNGPPGPLQPLVIGWERFFKLEWQAGMRGDRPVVWGHILNDYGFPADNVQLLVEGIGPGGEVLGQRVAWLGGGILAPGMRAYFEIPPPVIAPAYRVSVFAFDWVQTDDRRLFRF